MVQAQIIEIDGMEKFSFKIRTKKPGLEELTWLAASFDEQEEWATAIESHLKLAGGASVLSPDGQGSPDLNLRNLPVDKQGWLDMAGKTAGTWADKYVSISTKGFSWDDGESESKTASSPQADFRLKLVAESAEAYGAWIVALKWLEGGCRGPAPRNDIRMCVTNVPSLCWNLCCWSLHFAINSGIMCAGTQEEYRQDL